MSKKNKGGSSPMVYSTDPNFKIEEEQEQVETLAPEEQSLRIILETKPRAGKAVTIVYGFVVSEEEMNTLGKALKNHCGTGGSVKDGEIIIQGDHRQKVFQYLQQKGYKKLKLN